MTVYVLRMGFYHELLGIYTTRELAMEAARADWQRDVEVDGCLSSFEQQDYEIDEVELDQSARLL